MAKIKSPMSLFNKRFMKDCLQSSLLLYTLLAATMINLFVLTNEDDNESLFLFVIIAAVLYSFSRNMIIVLAGSIIFTNLLIFLRDSFINVQEGFEGEGLSAIDIQKWIMKTYLDDAEYPTYDSDIDGKGNINEIITRIMDNEMFDEKGKPLGEYDYDEMPVDELKKFITYIYDKYSDDDLENESDKKRDQIYFILDMYDDLTEYSEKLLGDLIEEELI